MTTAGPTPARRSVRGCAGSRPRRGADSISARSATVFPAAIVSLVRSCAIASQNNDGAPGRRRRMRSKR
ncbi:hypothetical protein [Lysobacter gummosus]|uniref:hypothetical protein n=1 Tax=Lysobacter gummosus TaxID=262324 RepID=UPI0036445C02